MRVVFRTEGGSSVGMGHLSRCLSLSHAIAEEAEVVFIVNKEASKLVQSQGYDVLVNKTFDTFDITTIKKLQPDLIIVDSYHADPNYVDSLRRIAKVALFDDNGEHNPITAHWVINGNIHAEDVIYETLYSETKFLLGPKYLTMNPEYWHRQPNHMPKAKGILIATGGSDTKRLMPKFARIFMNLPTQKRLIIGPFFSSDEINELKNFHHDFDLIFYPSSLKQYIEASEVVITASGSTVYEVLTLKRIPIIYLVAENQRNVFKSLKKFGVVDLCIEGNRVDTANDIFKKVVKVLENVEEFSKRLAPLFTLFDGKGAQRIINCIFDKKGDR